MKSLGQNRKDFRIGPAAIFQIRLNWRISEGITGQKTMERKWPERALRCLEHTKRLVELFAGRFVKTAWTASIRRFIVARSAA